MSDKRLEKGVARRKVILDAAIKCIATRGLCDTTLDRIAQIAGVSRTLVVFHFKSKNEMLKIVLSEIGAEYNQQWNEILESSKTLSAEKKLMRLVDYDLKLPIEKPDLISVWYTFWGEAKGLYKQFNANRDRKYDQDTYRLIESIINNGNYQTVNVKHVSAALSAMLLGFWWTAHLNPKQYNYQTNRKIIKSYLKLNFPDHFN